MRAPPLRQPAGWCACLAGLACTTVLWAAPAVASRLPDAGTLAGVGVSAHGPSGRDLDLMARSGIRLVRLDMTWERVETQAGAYDWSAYDGVAAALSIRRLRPLFVLDYGNRLYAPMASVKRHGAVALRATAPTTPRAVGAYAAFAAAAARRYAHADPVWELWNEPDVGHFWPPSADADAYSRLAGAACRAIRAAQPDATVIAPGVGAAPQPGELFPPFLQRVLRGDWLACVDGVSVHPYTKPDRLDAQGEAWGRLRQAISQASGRRRAPQPVASEWGQSAYRGLTERAQGGYLARMALLDMAAGVALTIYYDWRDDGADPADEQRHFGFIHADGSPKPALAALQTLTSRLDGYRFACRAPSPPGVIAMAFGSGGGRPAVVALWRRTDASGVAAAPAAGVDAMGAPVRAGAPLEVGVPVYVRAGREQLACGRRRPPAKAAGG